MNLHRSCIAFVFICFIALVATKKNTNRNLVEDVTDIKEFKKVLRTRKNVLVVFSSNEKAASGWMDTVSDTAFEMKGLATLVFVPCDDAKKMCKKLKVSPPPVIIKHYKDGEFNKDYDRLKTVKSMSKFLRDPTGDIPWEEEPGAQDVLHLETPKSFNKLLNSEKKPILTMFYAPWCGHCKRMKPEFAQAATELKSDAVLVGMDVDNPQSQGLRSIYNITGFPTILYFENGRKKYDFGGERTKDGIIEWMQDPQPPKEPEKEAEWSDEESEVVHLSDDSFDPYLLEHSSVLVMFYAPWCGHCKKMKPEYTEAAEQLKEDGLSGVLAAVDATKSPSVSSRFEIKGYPTVKYFKDGEFAWDVNERTADKIINHMKDPKEPPPPPPPEADWSEEETEVKILNSDTFKTFTKKKKHSLVMFYAPWCGHCKNAKPEFSTAAEELKDELKAAFVAMDCTIDTNRPICETYEVSGFPTFKYLNYGKNPEPYSGGRVSSDFVRFMQQKIDPDSVAPTPPPPPEEDFFLTLDGGENVKQLGSDFDEFIADKEAVLVMFYAPWCGHCKRMKPAYSEAATRALELGVNGIFAAVDATAHSDISGKFGVKGFPTIKLFQNGQLTKDYQGDRSTEDMLAFIQNPSREVPKPPEEAKWSDEPSLINHLTADNFDSFISTSQNVLTMFYAPWCGHCKKAKPQFTSAAEKLKDDGKSKLAAVDCTEHKEICDKHGVTGYPTFKLFQRGEAGDPYTGGRDAESFVNFMSSLTSSTSRQAGDL